MFREGLAVAWAVVVVVIEVHVVVADGRQLVLHVADVKGAAAFDVDAGGGKVFDMGHSRALFLYFRLFNTQLTVDKCSI